jgi:hypothetical protein
MTEEGIAEAHQREFDRGDARRNRPDPQRVARERDSLLAAAAADLGIDPPPSLADFPWTAPADDQHCLGACRIAFVDVPSDAPCATPSHAAGADALARRPLVVAYPASWAMQLGRHPDALFEGQPIDYFAFAPTYLRITARNMRSLFGEGPDAPPVVALAAPSVPESERKLSEYAYAELDGFCHPMLRPATAALFRPCFLDAHGAVLPRPEIERRFAGLVLAGYSYGCTLVLQQLADVRREMEEAGIDDATIAAAFGRLLCVFIGPNVDYERLPEVAKIAVRSPLDAVITGHDELGLHSTVTCDRATENFSAAELAAIRRGALEDVSAERQPIWIGANAVQFNFALPGVVRFDEEGRPLHPFRDGKHGHDIKAYIAAMHRNPFIAAAIRAALQNDGSRAIDLRAFFD